jgi:hypothetical protein
MLVLLVSPMGFFAGVMTLIVLLGLHEMESDDRLRERRRQRRRQETTGSGREPVFRTESYFEKLYRTGELWKELEKIEEDKRKDTATIPS